MRFSGCFDKQPLTNALVGADAQFRQQNYAAAMTESSSMYSQKGSAL
jgi:hypothetical protein